jgi:hypothetical protein
MTTRSRNTVSFVSVMILLVTMTAWSVASAQQPGAYELPGTEVFPEGIAYQPSQQAFYVSSTTNGTIFRGELDDPQAVVYLPGGADGRTTATGLHVDPFQRLWVSGGDSGMIWAYDTRTGELITALQIPGAGFINDVTFVRRSAYFTDSLTPYIYRVFKADGVWQVERWLNYDEADVEFQTGFNLNGITKSLGRFLIVVQSNTGKLFRIDTLTKRVAEIDLGGATVVGGDGIELRGRTLWVVRNSFELIAKIRLSDDRMSGEVLSETTDPSFMFPTTAAIVGPRLLVVNSQFDQRDGSPVLPFTVSNVPLP